MDNLVAQISTYISVSEEETAQIKNLFTEKTLRKGEALLKEGMVCRHLYFVSKGLLRHVINHGGRELTIHFNEENTFACDYSSFTARQPSSKTIEAIEKSVIYMISYEKLQHFYASVSEGERFGRLLVERIFNQAIAHIISVHTDTPEQRYVHFINTFSHLHQRIPQLYTASFIGVTPQSLSRIRRRLAQAVH